MEEVGGRQFQILFFSTYRRDLALNSSHEWVNHFGYKIMICSSPPINTIKATFVLFKICAVKCAQLEKRSIKTAQDSLRVRPGVRQEFLCLALENSHRTNRIKGDTFPSLQPYKSHPILQPSCPASQSFRPLPWCHGRGPKIPVSLCLLPQKGTDRL